MHGETAPAGDGREVWHPLYLIDSVHYWPWQGRARHPPEVGRNPHAPQWLGGVRRHPDGVIVVPTAESC